MKMRLGFLLAAMVLVWLMLARTNDARPRGGDVQMSQTAS